jgi:hypothetical protein
MTDRKAIEDRAAELRVEALWARGCAENVLLRKGDPNLATSFKIIAARYERDADALQRQIDGEFERVET